MKKFFIWGLLASSRFTPTMQESSEDEKDDYSYGSICNTHGHFANKVLQYSPEFQQGFDQVMQLRARYQANIDSKVRNLENGPDNKFHALFKDHKNYEQLKDYFKVIARTVEIAKMRRDENSGFCGEAAAASIVNSLLHQLENNERQTVQEIVIHSADKSINHAFVLYNSKRLLSQKINNNQLKTILSTVSAPEKGKPVICDEFDHFHGPASQWPEAFFNAKTHNYGKGTYAYMEVRDYSLPPLHKDFNAKQRNYIKSSLKKLLSEVKMCDHQENMALCSM